MVKKETLESRFRVWQSLMDTSSYFALAGMKLKGYSFEDGWKKLYQLWIKDSQEHRQADLNIIKKLNATRNKHK